VPGRIPLGSPFGRDPQNDENPQTIHCQKMRGL